MSSKSKTQIKAFFTTGSKPTESQFVDFIDSYVDKSGPLGQIESLASANNTGLAYVSAGHGEVLNAASTRAFLSLTAYQVATTAQAVAGTDANLIMDPVLTKNAIAAISGRGWVPIKTVTASNVTSVDFVNGSAGVVLDGTYKAYAIRINTLIPAADSVLRMRTSTDAGSSFDSGASDYGWLRVSGQGTSGTGNSGGDISDPYIDMGGGNISSGTGGNTSGLIYFSNPSATSAYKLFEFFLSGYSSTGGTLDHGTGVRLSTADIDGIRLFMSTGNILSGIFTLYGLVDAP